MRPPRKLVPTLTAAVAAAACLTWCGALRLPGYVIGISGSATAALAAVTAIDRRMRSLADRLDATTGRIEEALVRTVYPIAYEHGAQAAGGVRSTRAVARTTPLTVVRRGSE